MARRGLHLLLLAAGLLLALRMLGPLLPLTGDYLILEWFARSRNESLDGAMLAFTWLGSLTVLGPLTLVASASLCWKQRHKEGWFLLVSLAGAAVIGRLAKWWVARPRPDLHTWIGDFPLDYTFPSLHAMQAGAFFLAAAWIMRKRAYWAMAMLLAVGIGISRLYLQVHYPSDVLAGFCAAAVWTLVACRLTGVWHEKQIPRH